MGLPVCYGNQSNIFAASSGVVHLYTLHFTGKEKRVAVVAKETVHKQGSVQLFKFAGRLEFQSVSGLYKNFTRMSTTEFELLIHLTGEKISKRAQRSGKPFLFKKGWH
jgi:hypothetical protein